MSDNQCSYPCPRCQVGQCQCSLAPYLTVHDGMLVSVPDTPVWTCDICGYYEFEREAVSRLEKLMQQESPRPVRRRKPKVQPTPEGRGSGRVKP